MMSVYEGRGVGSEDVSDSSEDTAIQLGRAWRIYACIYGERRRAEEREAMMLADAIPIPTDTDTDTDAATDTQGAGHDNAK
jgi:hypothetical protein